MALIETIPVKEDYRRKMAYKLLMEGTDPSPIQHWAQGLGRMGQAALGGYEMYRADQKDKETEAGNNAALIAALHGGGAPAASPAATSPAQPTPQQPTARPPMPVSSVTPSAGAIPAALSGDVPSGAVMPKTATNPNGGMYGGLNWRPIDSEPPPEAGPKLAANGPVAMPPAAPVAPPADPAVPSPSAPEMDAAKARLIQMLQSDNPQMRKLGQNMAQTMLTSQLAGDKPTDEMREYKLARDQGFKGSFVDFKTELKKAGATNVTTNVGGGSDKQIFDTMDEASKGARATAAGLTGLREARNALEGGAITGAGADQRLMLQKVGSALGIADPSKIVNTETFRAAIAPQVAAVLKSTVGTANISNTDREFAEKAAGGSITLDQKSITRLMDIMERASVGQLDAHQKRLDAVYGDPEKFKRERALFGVEMPAAPARAVPAAPKVDLKKKYGLD